MTETLRKTVAQRFRAMLDRGILRKNAILAICQKFHVSPRSLYAYCKRFGISTR